MAAATALDGAMMNESETLTVLALYIGTDNRMYGAYNSRTTANKQVCCRLGTTDIDACHWIGVRAVTGQEYAFPRIGLEQLEREANIPAGSSFDAWSTLLVPLAIRGACAIQAAVHAVEQAGWAIDDWPPDSGHAGAKHPWARLHPRAATIAAPYRRTTFAGV